MRNSAIWRQIPIHFKDHPLKKAKGWEIERDEANEQHCFVLIHTAILLRDFEARLY
jgi:hypothetical protein